MAVNHYWYARLFVNIMAVGGGDVFDWGADVIKIMMTTNSYTPNQDTDNDKADVTNEVSGTAYTATGETLANKTGPTISAGNPPVIDIDNTNDADSTWEASSIANARRAVIYDSTPGSDATRPLMSWIEFGQDETSSSGDFAINMNAAGIATITPTDASGFPA